MAVISGSLEAVIHGMRLRASCVALALCASSLVGLAAAHADGATVRDRAAHDLAQRFATERPAGSLSDQQRRAAEEAEMLEQARREAAERAALSAAAPNEDIEAERIRELEAAREAEARQLAEKLRRAEEARRSRAGDGVKPEWPQSAMPRPQAPPPVASDREREPASALIDARPDPRVTVLLVMEPGNRGIRRFNKTADPVLCVGAHCYVSAGAAKPARLMSRSRALGSLNTLGRRADACNQKLACVYRGVYLPADAPLIQPVDLKIMVHDRRTPRAASADRSCRLSGGNLSCARTITAPGYRAWVLPEALAMAAGPGILEEALRRGLVGDGPQEASLR
jgi:hypothetical protein